MFALKNTEKKLKNTNEPYDEWNNRNWYYLLLHFFVGCLLFFIFAPLTSSSLWLCFGSFFEHILCMRFSPNDTLTSSRLTVYREVAHISVFFCWLPGIMYSFMFQCKTMWIFYRRWVKKISKKFKQTKNKCLNKRTTHIQTQSFWLLVDFGVALLVTMMCFEFHWDH